MIKPYHRTFSGIAAVQEQDEFAPFLDFIKSHNVKSYLEVGTARGDTFHEIVSQMPAGSKALAIDYPEQAWGLNDSKVDLRLAVEDLAAKGYDADIVFGHSQDRAVIECAEEDGPFDLVFIDGDHTMQGVTADWLNYGRLGRMVAFHDIVDTMRPNLRGEKIEVPLFWQELKKKYRHVEFVAPKSTMGIGVIFTNAD